MSRNAYAMQILKFQNTNQIELAELREFDPKFLIPQMYYFLDNTELLRFLNNRLIPCGDVIQHDFTNITSDMICRY